MLASGCWDRRELDDQAFVLTIGIDKGPQNQLLVTFRIAIPSKAGLGPGGGTSGPGSVAKQASLLTTIAAPTIPAAMALASGYIDRDLNLMHTKTVLFGETYAKDGIAPVLNLLTRYRELRRNIFLGVTKGYAYEFLAANEPDLEKSFAKWWEGVKMMESSQAIHPGTQLNEFLNDLESDSRAGIMMYLAVNKQAKNKDAKNLKIPPDFAKGTLSVKAGDIPRIGGDPSEIVGTAVFKGDKFDDVLNLVETRSLLMLSGDMKKALYSIPDPEKKNNYIAVEIKQGSPPKIKVTITGDQILIKEALSLEGDLLDIQSGINYAAYFNKQTELNRSVEAVIKQRAESMLNRLQSRGIDIVGYSDYAKRNFWTEQDWKYFNWVKKYPTAKIVLDVNFNLRRTGMQGKQPSHTSE